MPVIAASQFQDVVARRLALVRSLRDRLLDGQGDEPLKLQDEIGRNLWLIGAEFDSRALKADECLMREGVCFFADAVFGAASQRSVGFYTRRTSNPFLPGHGITQLVIVLLSQADIAAGEAERSMIWRCVKHLRAQACLRQDARVAGFVLSHLFDADEHDTVQHGESTVIQPVLIHPMLDKAEYRLINMI